MFVSQEGKTLPKSRFLLHLREIRRDKYHAIVNNNRVITWDILIIHPPGFFNRTMVRTNRVRSMTLSRKIHDREQKDEILRTSAATSIPLRLPSTRMQWPVLTIANSNDRSSRSGVLCRAKKSKTSLRESSYVRNSVISETSDFISLLSVFCSFRSISFSPVPGVDGFEIRLRIAPWIIANKKKKYGKRGKGVIGRNVVGKSAECCVICRNGSLVDF